MKKTSPISVTCNYPTLKFSQLDQFLNKTPKYFFPFLRHGQRNARGTIRVQLTDLKVPRPFSIAAITTNEPLVSTLIRNLNYFSLSRVSRRASSPAFRKIPTDSQTFPQRYRRRHGKPVSGLLKMNSPRNGFATPAFALGLEPRRIIIQLGLLKVNSSHGLVTVSRSLFPIVVFLSRSSSGLVQ